MVKLRGLKLFQGSGKEDLAESPAVDEIFDRLSYLGGVQLLAMAAGRKGTEGPALDGARARAKAVAAQAGLGEGLARVRDRALHWASQPEPRYAYASAGMANPLWDDARPAAAQAIVDAATAVALGRRLDATAYDLLIEPWRRATAVEPERPHGPRGIGE